MLKTLRIISIVTALIVIILSIYYFLTGNMIPYVIFFLGVMILLSGIVKLLEKQKKIAIFFFIASTFIFASFIFNLYQ